MDEITYFRNTEIQSVIFFLSLGYEEPHAEFQINKVFVKRADHIEFIISSDILKLFSPADTGFYSKCKHLNKQ